MVILLVTGPFGGGKDKFVDILRERYNYTINIVKKCSIENLWDYENQKPILDRKKEILEETEEVIKLSLKNWRQNQIIYPIYFPESVDQITKKRSYFRIVGVVAPLERRLENFKHRYPHRKDIALEAFMKMDDFLNFGVGIQECLGAAEFQILNSGSDDDLLQAIKNHDLITKKIFRPSWDLYFMKLAHVVRERSNCMKRSVGAILIQNNRIVSTGYNGTPGKLVNCYQDGCERCNNNKSQGVDLDKCNCIHAEEAAILECGVHRAKGGTLYTTLAPCRWCTKILIQAEVKRVVYDQTYSMDGCDQLFLEAGILIDVMSVDMF